MSLVVPDAAEVRVLTDFLTPDLTIRLYSNDPTLAGTMTASSFTEVAGGGYANKPLVFANWGLSASDPSIAIYNTTLTWDFTGATSAPGNIYGYYVTRDSDGLLMWAERFPSANVPFVPENGSKINILAKFTCQSAN